MSAPKGNTNALKHGLYASRYDPEDRHGVRDVSPEDYHQEIEMLRRVIGNLFELHERLNAGVTACLDAGQPADVEPLSRITNSLSLAITSLNTTSRTHAILSGRDASLNDAFEQALASLPIFADKRILLLADPQPEKTPETPPEVVVE